MGKKRVRFDSEKNAKSFSKKVNGNVNDCRGNENSKSNFTVTFDKGKPKPYDNSNDDWSPEDGRDFGYPNDYWK